MPKVSFGATTTTEVPAAVRESDTVPPSSAKRQQLRNELGTRGVFTGLKNLGATCYMNALLQVLFFTPEYRKVVLELPFESAQRHPKNIAYQLQLLFARMARDSAAFVNPKDLVDSFGMGQDAHRQQHDVQELSRVLNDIIYTFAAKCGTGEQLTGTYQGTFEDYKKCLTCRTRTFSQNPFQDVSLTIRGHDSLAACFDAFVKPNEIEGVRCDACNANQVVHKGLSFAKFPHVLFLQLVRMDFDLQTLQREKVQQDVVLPLTLNITSWLTSHTTEEGEEATKQTGNQFHLHSVIAHRGTAYHGHYYCFVRVSSSTQPVTVVSTKAQQPPAPKQQEDAEIKLATAEDVGGTWVKFDDDTVSYATPDEVEEYINPASWKRRRSPSKTDAEEKTPETVSATNTPATASSNGPKVELTVDDVTTLPDAFVEDGDVMALFGSGGATTSSSSSGSQRYVCGHSYYAVYRCEAIPQLEYRPSSPAAEAVLNDLRHLNIPAYVKEIVDHEEAERNKKMEELRSLMKIIPVGIHVPQPSHIQVTAMTPRAGLAPLKKYWVDCTEATTILQLTEVAKGFCTQLWDQEEQQPTIGGSQQQKPSYFRLREYSHHLSVMGGSYEDPAKTLKDLGYDAVSLTSFPLFALETSVEAPTTWRPCAEWDLTFEIRKFDEETNAFVDIPGQAAVYRDATLQEFIEVAANAAGYSCPHHSVITLELQGKAESLQHHADTGEPLSLDLPLKHTSITKASKVYIEKAAHAIASVPEPIVIPEPWLATTQAAVHIEKQHLVTVHYDPNPTTTADADVDAPMNSKQSFVIDGRKKLRQVKEELCRRVAGGPHDPAQTQMLVSGARREYHDLQGTVRAAAIVNSGKLEVALALGAPLQANEAYVQLYVTTGDYLAPVAPLGQALLHDTDTVEVLVQQAAAQLPLASSLLPSLDPSLIRMRLMPPNRKNALGAPLLKPVVMENMTNDHQRDNLHLVLEPISKPETLTKASIILHLHHWDPFQSTPQSALGHKQQVVTLKDSLVKDLWDVLVAATGVESLDVAKAKGYQLASMNSVAKLLWGFIDTSDAETMQKHCGGYPVKLEQDDVVLWRNKEEPWPEGIVVARFQGSETSAMSAKKKKKSENGPSSASGSRKKGNEEVAIRMEAVWDYVPAAEDESPHTTPPQQAPAISTESAVSTSKSNNDLIMEVCQCELFDPNIHATIDEACKICFCPYEEGEEVLILPCHDMFHKDCIATWIAINPVCPSCKESLLR